MRQWTPFALSVRGFSLTAESADPKLMQVDAKRPNQYAEVKVEGAEQLVSIPISWEKPEIPESIQNKWQAIVDLTAEILRVPTGLITRLTKDNLEIFVASQTPGNPYKRNDRDRLGIGMFCETVAGRQKGLIVPDTAQSDYWRNNPHAQLGMHAYMGVPIRWDDGELFGTFCMLDNKANSYSDTYLDLLERFKDLIETDLKNVLLQEELEKRLSASEMKLREIHHRIKNQFNILTSYISLQSRGKDNADFQQTLHEIQHRIVALSLVHEDLYRSDTLSVPPLDSYLPRLCSYMVNDFARDEIKMKFDIERIELPMDAEISIGLMVSELITNSLKYAFGGDEEKTIRLTVKRTRAGELFMEYRDTGVGLPMGFVPAERSSLGMRILTGLTNQLGGTMETATDRGAVFAFRFAL
jgi:two-component sensor histidine kinase